MVKKKVSFDVDQKILDEVKKICQLKGIKLADFFREAVSDKLSGEKQYITIFVPLSGKIEKFKVDRSLYDIDMFEASHEMKINVGAECEGVVSMKQTSSNADTLDDLDPLQRLLIESNTDRLRFYTKIKYIDCKEKQ